MKDWVPEPLVAPPTEVELVENEKRPVIVGYVDIFLQTDNEFLITV